VLTFTDFESKSNFRKKIEKMLKKTKVAEANFLKDLDGYREPRRISA